MNLSSKLCVEFCTSWLSKGNTLKFFIRYKPSLLEMLKKNLREHILKCESFYLFSIVFAKTMLFSLVLQFPICLQMFLISSAMSYRWFQWSQYESPTPRFESSFTYFNLSGGWAFQLFARCLFFPDFSYSRNLQIGISKRVWTMQKLYALTYSSIQTDFRLGFCFCFLIILIWFSNTYLD